jgi:acetate kinase
VASVLPAEIAAGRVVVAHLGSGASMCALRAGRSVDSTMGFTALDGLPMGTRSGQLDPGVLLYLAGEGMSIREIEGLLYRKSGLLGLSGVSNDMRDLLASAEPRAKFAVDHFVYAITKNLGALTAALGGLDALVFTAGIGERSPVIRARVCEAAAWLGVELDPDANAGHGPRISRRGSRVSAWVIPTNEELMIARHTAAALAGQAVAARTA